MSNHNITKPTLLVDIERVRTNIKRMSEKAQRNNVEFRPHFKTHQSAEIGEIFREFGVNKITVTTVEMAEYFAQHGWSDITIAMPVNLREIDKINELTSIAPLGLIVDSEFSSKFLSENIFNKVNIWIEINAGYNRSGVINDSISEILRITEIIRNSQKLKLSGILSHFGNTYSAKSLEDVQNIFADSHIKMQKVRILLESKFGSEFKISVGDTPSCSILEDFGQVDEIRPGNFVFYDLMQLNIGACTEKDIAVTLACPVISKNSEKNEIVLYGGAIHLSKEYIIYNGRKCFGAITSINAKSWCKIIQNAFVKSISQEHAVVNAPESLLKTVEIGDLLGIIPVHSCLTANLMRKYLTTDDRIIEMAKFR